MQLDPTRWMVNIVGFLTDWAISREWSRIGVSCVPMFFLAFMVSLVFLGSRMDARVLSNRYLKLGEEEVAEWEASWSGRKGEDKEKGDQPTQASVESPKSEASGARKELSRFAEVLFKRVQLLEPNDRSQFIIAATMAQRGATGSARRMLQKIAPDDRPGYGPAHAFIVESLLRDVFRLIRQAPDQVTPELKRLVRHHLEQAIKWDNVPEFVVVGGSEFLWALGERDAALRMAERASEISPSLHLFAAKLAAIAQSQINPNGTPVSPIAERILKHSATKAKEYYTAKVEENRSDVKYRLALAECLALNGGLQEAETVLLEGKQYKDAPEYNFALSEVYRQKFRKSIKQDAGQMTGDIQLLEVALKLDPTNSLVAEEIARLARVNGPAPSPQLIEALQEFLAHGKATAVTHALISDLYLLKQDFKQALPHLEQVVTRLPTSAQYMNNLAFVLVEEDPKRMDEALQLAKNAVKYAPGVADYHDTLAKVLIAMGKHREAIAALENAISLQANRLDFHENLAKEYQAIGDDRMHQLHQKRVEEIRALMKRPPDSPPVPGPSPASTPKLEAETPQAAESTEVNKPSVKTQSSPTSEAKPEDIEANDINSATLTNTPQ